MLCAVLRINTSPQHQQAWMGDVVDRLPKPQPATGAAGDPARLRQKRTSSLEPREGTLLRRDTTSRRTPPPSHQKRIEEGAAVGLGRVFRKEPPSSEEIQDGAAVERAKRIQSRSRRRAMATPKSPAPYNLKRRRGKPCQTAARRAASGRGS